MKIAIFIRILVTCSLSSLATINSWAESNNKTIISSFVPDTYTSVSFEELKAHPEKYSGSAIRVQGFLGRDFDWADTQTIPALYNKPIQKSGEPEGDALKISISPFYAYVLYKFGFPKECTVFGVYVVPPNNAGASGLFSIMRIDHVATPDGQQLDVKFDL